MPHYEHTQFGRTIVGILLAFAAGIGGAALVLGAAGPVLAAPVVLGLAAVALGALTITVDPWYVTAQFGLRPLRGWFRRRVPVSEIAAAAPVRNRWFWGWGIRYTPRGWLYCVDGLDAVELVLRSGRRVRFGTDEPDAVIAALAGTRGGGGAGATPGAAGRQP